VKEMVPVIVENDSPPPQSKYPLIQNVLFESGNKAPSQYANGMEEAGRYSSQSIQWKTL
jgi:hypothetical protein